MEQLDILELKQDLKKDRLRRMSKDKSVLLSAAVGMAQIPGILFTEEQFFRTLNCFVLGFEISLLKRAWKKEGLVEEQLLIHALRHSITYQELEDEYNKYIKDVAELIRHVGLKSSKEVVIYLHGLMELGYFAKYMQHKYKIFKNENDYLIEVLGAKVLSGTSVCRHMSSFIVDVINELGHTAANISVTHETENPVRRIQKKNVILNHAVAGIVENGEKFLFDATCGHFAALPWDFDFKEEESIHVSQFVIPEQKRYLIMCPKLDILNYGRDEECAILNATKLMKMTPEEVAYIRSKIEKVLQGNLYNQHTFFVTHEEQRKRITELYQELCPYSDNKILSYKVRK